MDKLTVDQFHYELPDDRIARFPLPERDQSKLLVYQAGQISHRYFYELTEFLPANSFLVFNNTKVIPARLFFTRSTGAVIELFLLNPVPADRPIGDAMQDLGTTVWQCMIGNRKRWKAGEILHTVLPTPEGEVAIAASLEDAEQSLIRFSWLPASETFAQVIQKAGQVPLPPYLKRAVTDADRETYQTVYSKEEGAVAAPTAGLHFTDRVFQQLTEKGIKQDYLTLHVGAGTFQPIKTDDPRQHQMHVEQVVYTQDNIRNFLAHIDNLLPVGTTSMRSLESLYWMGIKCLRNDANPLFIDQHYAYRHPVTEGFTATDALQAILAYMEKQGQQRITAHTGIYIMPGYKCQLCKGIITNFHQPGSTLILLIAALIEDNWRTVYKEALLNDYRFLSYGDSSLLLP